MAVGAFAGCKYNQVNSHFHCIREGCQFSFLLKHQMTSHARKHMRRMLGKNFDRVPASQVRVAPQAVPPLPEAPTWPASRSCFQQVGGPLLSTTRRLSGPPEPDGHGDR